MDQSVPECPRLIERPFPIVISGASGTGKTSLVEKLLAADGRIIRGVTATSRQPRAGEEEGVDYIFFTKEEFEKKKEAGYFVESARVHGEYYGVPKEKLKEALKKGKWVVLNVDVQGALSFKKVIPDAILIFVLPPSMEALEERLRNRGTDNPEEIKKRLERAQDEMITAPQYDYVVVNDEIKDCTKRLLAILRAESSRTTRGLMMPKD